MEKHGQVLAKGSRKLTINVFRVTVQEPIISGLTAFVLNKTDTDAFDRMIQRFGRVVMLGKACKKNEEEDKEEWINMETGEIQADTIKTTTYESLNNKTVYRALRLVPSELEIRVRRLKWYQAVAAEPDLHCQTLASWLGTMKNDKGPTMYADGSLSSTANPWAKQIAADLHTLVGIDEGQELLDMLDGRVRQIFGNSPTTAKSEATVEIEHITDRFLRIDMAALRSAYWGHCIPPPGYERPIPAGGTETPPAADDGTPEVFRCEMAKNDGEICGEFFASKQALHGHQVASKEHKKRNVISLSVVTNQCPVCRSVLSTKKTARQHMAFLGRSGICQVDRAIIPKEVVVPDDLSCPICSHEEFEDLFSLQDHIVAEHLSHLSPTLVFGDVGGLDSEGTTGSSASLSNRLLTEWRNRKAAKQEGQGRGQRQEQGEEQGEEGHGCDGGGRRLGGLPGQNNSEANTELHSEDQGARGSGAGCLPDASRCTDSRADDGSGPDLLGTDKGGPRHQPRLASLADLRRSGHGTQDLHRGDHKRAGLHRRADRHAQVCSVDRDELDTGNDGRACSSVPDEK